MEETYSISSYKDKEFIIMIIREFNLDRDLIIEWIENYLINDVNEELDKFEEEMAKEDFGVIPVSNKENLGPLPAEKVNNNEEADLNAFLS